MHLNPSNHLPHLFISIRISNLCIPHISWVRRLTNPFPFPVHPRAHHHQPNLENANNLPNPPAVTQQNLLFAQNRITRVICFPFSAQLGVCAAPSLVRGWELKFGRIPRPSSRFWGNEPYKRLFTTSSSTDKLDLIVLHSFSNLSILTNNHVSPHVHRLRPILLRQLVRHDDGPRGTVHGCH